MSELTGSWVDMGFAGTGGPDVRTAVQRARDRAEANRGARRVVVASFLLAEGLFQERLRASGADVVTRPLGTHPGLAQLVANRFRSAVARQQRLHRWHGTPTPVTLDL